MSADGEQGRVLLPCPFCGGVPRLFPVIIPFDADCDAITIQCAGCDAIGANILVDQFVHGVCDLPSLEAEAIAVWNTRAAPTTDTPDAVGLCTILCDLERSATAVYRNGAVTGPQWSLLGSALIRARAALAKHPTSPEDAA